jgi:hypothetical protein
MHNLSTELSIFKFNSTGELNWKKPHYGGDSYPIAIGFTNPNFKIVNQTVVCTVNQINGIVNGVETFKIGNNGELLWQSKTYNSFSGGVESNLNGDVLVATQKTNNALYQNDLTKLRQYNAYDVADVSLIPSSNLSYFEYVGQLKNMDGISIKSLAYYGFNNDNGYYLFDDKISFTHFTGDQDSTTLDTLKRWDFKFQGANIVEPTGFNTIDYFNNYYYADLKRERVNGYKK